MLTPSRTAPVQVYIATIFPNESPALLTLLKTAGLDTMLNLRHSKRIRKPSPDSKHVQVLVCPVEGAHLSELEEVLRRSSLTPTNGDDIPIGIVSVPANPARTQAQQKEWSKKYWPVTLVPVKADVLAKEREEYFTKSKLRWMQSQLSEVVRYANSAAKKGELGVACRVTETWENEHHMSQDTPVLLSQAHDTRTLSSNPLEHAVMNVISHVANLDKTNTRPSGLRKSDYLLTGLTVFMTHEPCLLCSMALLHSRISTLVYVRDSPGAGGAGTEYSLHEEVRCAYLCMSLG
jgi:tRNA-specific adenosine deaminase 3